MIDSETASALGPNGTQTLLRGLAVIECVANGITDAKRIAEQLDTPRSSVNRVLTSLAAGGFLHHIPYKGYLLGPKIIKFGMIALDQRPVVDVARPSLLALAAATRDTVYLGVLDGTDVLYLDKVPGQRGLDMRSQVGSRVPVTAAALGKALISDLPPETWRALHEASSRQLADMQDRPAPTAWADFHAGLVAGLTRGWATDMEEIEFGIRCVAAPVRDVTRKVVAAISVASIVRFMPDDRITELGPAVRACADEISERLGWTPDG
jgi:DNA-binding IclR family transcriptional regulator